MLDSLMRRAIVACAMLMAATAGAETPNLERLVHSIDTDLGNIENRLRRLERDVENPVARSVYYPMEKRLVDARVHFELKNYDKSAVLYMDAIRHSQFRSHPDRQGVLYRLSFSLFKIKNYLAARLYLKQLLQTANNKYYQQALALLIEAGLTTRLVEGLQESVRQAVALQGRTSALQYVLAKGLYRLGRSQNALAEFSRITPSAPEYAGAQYYSGVIYTDRKKLEAALKTFTNAAKSSSTSNKTTKIRELAFLAMGRIYLEKDKFTEAIDAYQEIDRHSAHFHTALYEMTWAYVNQKEFEKALNALEILLLTVEDEQLATRANILRGRLNMMLEQTDVAVGTYNEIVRKFAPLRDELDRFAKRKKNLRAYFRWLLNRHVDAFQVGDVLSTRASRWLETDESLKDVVALFDEMSRERKDVLDARLMVAELEAALTSGNQVEIFPNLKNAWTRIVIGENNLIEISQRAIEAEGRLAIGRMSASEREQYNALVARRRILEKKFAKVPKTEVEFNDRLGNVRSRFARLRRDVFLAETNLKATLKSLAAMQKWVQEARYSGGKRKLDKAEQAKLFARLKGERDRLRRLGRSLTKVKYKIGRDKVTVGAGDFVSQKEAKLKEQLLEAHNREQAIINLVIDRLGGDERRLAERLQSLRRRILIDFNAMGTLLNKINTAVKRKVKQYRARLSQEKKLLAVYTRKVKGFSRESDLVARDVGVPLFKLAHKRISDVVLEADLGLVDVAWRRKIAETDKIRVIQEEQAEQMRNLEKAIKDILKD